MDVDLHLAEDAAEDGCGRQAFDTRQLIAELMVGQVEEILVVARVAGDDQVADRNGRRIILQDAGRQHARWQVLHFAVDKGNYLAGGDVGIDFRPEVHLDDADAEQRARFDMFQVVAVCQSPFQDGGDALLHVRGRHAAVRREHDDHRDFQVRKNVRRRAHLEVIQFVIGWDQVRMPEFDEVATVCAEEERLWRSDSGEDIFNVSPQGHHPLLRIVPALLVEDGVDLKGHPFVNAQISHRLPIRIDSGVGERCTRL